MSGLQLKKILFLVLMIFVVGCGVLVGCSGDVENNKVDEEITQRKFFNYDIPEDTIAIVVNEFTKEEYDSVDNISKLVLDDSKESILLATFKSGVKIEIWSVDFDGENLIEKDLKFEIKSSQKDFVLDIQCYRSEGIPNYKIKLIEDTKTLEYYITTTDGIKSEPIIEYLKQKK